MRRGREDGHVRSSFGHDHLGAAWPDPADGEPPLGQVRSTTGSRWPSIRACSINRPDIPVMSLATLDSLMPASSSSFSSRWISRLRSRVMMVRARVRSRSSRIGAGGTNEPRTSPCAPSCANQVASEASLVGPGPSGLDRLAAPLAGDADADAHLRIPLRHIQPRTADVDDFHDRPPARAPTKKSAVGKTGVDGAVADRHRRRGDAGRSRNGGTRTLRPEQLLSLLAADRAREERPVAHALRA